MRTILVVISLLSLTLNLAWSKDIPSGVSKTDLSVWGQMHVTEVGTLLNMPIGSHDSQVKGIEKLVREIAQKLVPDIFKNFQISVSVYPGQNPMIFIENVELDRAEELPRVLKEIYHFDTSKPIYNLGISVGLFSKIKTQDELAFLIGRELHRLLQGQLEDPKIKEQMSFVRKWWSNQSYESVNDNKAIESMLGKYDLDAALQILWTLASLDIKTEGKDNIANALNAYMSGEQDRGVRISLAQSYIEYLRGRKQDALPRPQKPLDEKLAKPRNERLFSYSVGDKFNNLELDLMTKVHNELVEKLLTTSDIEAAEPKSSIVFLLLKSEYDDAVKKLVRKVIAPETMDILVNRATQSILNNKTYSKEMKIIALLRSRYLYSSWLGGDNREAEIALHPYHSALIQVIGKNPVDWSQVITRLDLSPQDVLADSMAIAAKGTPAGQQFIELVMRSLLFSPGYNGWVFDHSKSEAKLNFNSLSNFLINRPFGNLEYKKRNGFKTEVSDFPFARPAFKTFYDALSRFTPYFDSSDFFRGKTSTDFDRESVEAYLNFVYGIERDPKYSPGYENPFVLAALKNSQAVKKVYSEKRKEFLLSLADATLDQKAIGEMSEYLNSNHLSSLDKEEVAALSKAHHRIVKSALYSSEISNISDLTTLTNTLVKNDLMPIGTAEQNLDSLVILGILGVPSKEEDRTKFETTIKKLSQNINFDQLKKVLTTIYFTQPEARFQNELQSERYKKNHSELFGLFEKYQVHKLRDLLIKIPFSSSEMLKVMTLPMYFDNHQKYSSDELDAHLGILRLLGMNGLSTEWANRFSLEDIRLIINNIYVFKSRAKQREKAFHPSELNEDRIKQDVRNFAENAEGNSANAKTVAFLLDIFNLRQSEIKDFSTWAKSLRSLLIISSSALDERPDYKDSFEKKFLELSNQGTDPKAYFFVRNSSLQKALSERSLVPVMLAEIKRRMKDSRDPNQLKIVFEQIDQDQKLKETLPDVYQALRKETASTFTLQPHNINSVFPESDLEVNSDNSKGFSSEIRGLSALVHYSRSRTISEQIELIEYLMGRQASVPNFIVEGQKKTNSPLIALTQNIKIKMDRESELSRSFLVNSLITGPDGVMSKPENEKIILDHLLKNVGHKEIAREMAEALMRSLGQGKSLAIGYVFAQKSESGKLNEGDVLLAVFEAFGVAGIKLGQYLGFTSELAEFRTALAPLQDSAMPVSYLDMLHLVRKRLGNDWSKNWNIVKLIGSGSVNIAIIVKSPTTGEERVISILRDEIETASRENFRKLSEFVNELLKGKSGKSFEFLPGLLKIIETSVSLEFNKQNSHDRQIDANIIYNQDIKGWQIRAPKVFEVENGSLAMEKASGITARKLRTQNPAQYNEIMTHVLNVEFQHLMNATFVSKRITSAIANPDLHDGQVIIDLEKRKVTILDFGQAVEITKAERDLGLQFLRILNITSSEADLKKQIEAFQKSLNGKQNLTQEEINNIFKRTDMMDRFVYMLGVAQKKNWNVSLSTVHFILGINRIMKLGDAVGINVTSRLRTIIKTRVLTGSVELGYYISKMLEQAAGIKTEIMSHMSCKSKLGG